MKNYLLLFILLFSGQKSFCQIDSFLVADHYFYSVGPELWITEHGDNGSGENAFNMRYTHPVRTECALAQINLQVNIVESSSADTVIKKKQPDKDYSSLSINRKYKQEMKSMTTELAFQSVDDYTCGVITNTFLNRNCKQRILNQVYLYPINDTLEISANLIANIPDYETLPLTDSLQKFMVRFFNLNKKAIRELNPNFLLNFQVDSFTLKGKQLVYPIPAGWKQSRKFEEDSTDCTGKRFNINQYPDANCLNIRIGCSVVNPKNKLPIITGTGIDIQFVPFSYSSNIEIPPGLFFSYFRDSISNQPDPDSIHFYISEYNNLTNTTNCGIEKYRYMKQYIVTLENLDGKTMEIEYWLGADCKSITDIIRYDEAMKIFFSYVKTYNDFEKLYR